LKNAKTVATIAEAAAALLDAAKADAKSCGATKKNKKYNDAGVA